METREIVQRAGGPTVVARACHRHHATVIGWGKVPAKHARTVSRLSGLPLAVVCPEVFSDEGDDAHDVVQAVPGVAA